MEQLVRIKDKTSQHIPLLIQGHNLDLVLLGS